MNIRISIDHPSATRDEPEGIVSDLDEEVHLPENLQKLRIPSTVNYMLNRDFGIHQVS